MACRLVGNFRPIVRIRLGAVDDRRYDGPVRHAVASQLVGDQPPGRATLTLQQLTEEAFGGAGVSPSLNQDIKHITVLINSTPEILSLTRRHFRGSGFGIEDSTREPAVVLH